MSYAPQASAGSAGQLSYSERHLQETAAILRQLDAHAIEAVAELIAQVKAAGGRLFFLGVGGSAANCSHAVSDFRNLTDIECYAPTDNVAELTARTNDEGWASVFEQWLKTSRLAARDALFILSVGGGDTSRNISPNLVSAIRFARQVGAKVTGIVGRDGGYTALAANACVVIPTVNPDTVTPHTEAFQGIVCHLLVSHPLLKTKRTKWESAVADVTRG